MNINYLLGWIIAKEWNKRLGKKSYIKKWLPDNCMWNYLNVLFTISLDLNHPTNKIKHCLLVTNQQKCDENKSLKELNVVVCTL